MTIDGDTVVLIVNPAAHNGAGREAAAHAEALLRRAVEDNSAPGEGVAEAGAVSLSPVFRNARVARVFTDHPGYASEIARDSAGCRAVIALGGDGLVNEVVNGLMALAPANRPVLGVLPLGSGNDYARELGMPFDIDAAVEQLVQAGTRVMDVGLCNGRYFAETLSFGIDAAIALDTVERRKRTGKTGAALYFASGIDQLTHHLRAYPYHALFDGEAENSASITFAVQIGRTYGGGFLICPDAKPDDGLFDICIAHPPAGIATAVYVFARAKNGHHGGCKQIAFHRAAHVHVEFEDEPAVQADGEPLYGKVFDVQIVPRAIQALSPLR